MYRIVVLVLLLAATALPALAGDVLVSANDISIPKGFLCAEAKEPAGRYGLEVSFETSPALKSTLKVTKAGKTLCTIEGAGTTQHDKMSTTKVRLFTRVDAERKAVEVVVVTPTGMRGSLRNQIFYLPLAESSAQ
jgi:hypothetical protein